MSGRFERFFRQVGRDFRLWLFFTAALMLYRVVFILIFREEIGDGGHLRSLLAALLAGLRFDAQAATYWILPPLAASLFSLVGNQQPSRPAHDFGVRRLVAALGARFRAASRWPWHRPVKSGDKSPHSKGLARSLSATVSSCPAFSTGEAAARRVRAITGLLFAFATPLISVVAVQYYREYHDVFDQMLFHAGDDDTAAIATTLYHSYNLVACLTLVVVLGGLAAIVGKRWALGPLLPQGWTARLEKGDSPHLPGPTSGRCPPSGCFAQKVPVPLFPQVQRPAVADQLVRRAASLGALASIGRASAERLAGEALPGVGHAEGPVDEGLQADAGLGVDLGDLADRQLAGQHHSLEPQRLRHGKALGAGQGHLGRGVHRQLGADLADQPGQSEVLHHHGIGPRRGHAPHGLFQPRKLAGENHRIQRDVSLEPATAEEIHHFGQLYQVEVGRPGTRVEARVESEVDRVGPIFHGRTKTIPIPRRSEQLRPAQRWSRRRQGDLLGTTHAGDFKRGNCCRIGLTDFLIIPPAARSGRG